MYTRTRTHAHTSRLIMKFHSSPVWKFFLIKFHLLRLGFHHPITGRRAEMLIHAWLHQAPGENQSMPPLLFHSSLSVSYLLWPFSAPLHAPPSPPVTSPRVFPSLGSCVCPNLCCSAMLFLFPSLTHAWQCHVTVSPSPPSCRAATETLMPFCTKPVTLPGMPQRT